MVESTQRVPAASGLPPTWSPGRDLMCVAGLPCEGFFEFAVEAGVKRLFLFLPEGVPVPEAPAEFDLRPIVVRSQLELMTAMQHLPGELPHHIQLKRWDTARITDELLQEVARTLKESLSAKKLAHDTVEVWGRLWAERVLENLFHLASTPSVAALDGAFAGVPCFLVAPGPSLEKNIEELRRVKGRGIVISTSHALRSLQAAGVHADLVIAGDPGKLLQRHFHGVDVESIGALVLGTTNEPGQFELTDRPVFSFESNQQIDEWLFGPYGENAHLPTGGSVACSALSLALRMGCEPITFVGQDLAFTGDQYYASTTYDGSSRVALAEDGKSFVLERSLGSARQAGESAVILAKPDAVFEVPAYGGGTVRTSIQLRHFLEWFQTVVKSVTPQHTVYNCTEGGAHMDGARHEPLARVLDELPNLGLDATAVLDAAWGGVDATLRRADMARRLDGMLTALQSCLGLAKNCVALSERASEDGKALHRLDREEKRLFRSVEPLTVLSLIAQKRIREATARGREAETQAEILTAARELYDVVLEAGRELGPALRESHSRFEAVARS